MPGRKSERKMGCFISLRILRQIHFPRGERLRRNASPDRPPIDRPVGRGRSACVSEPPQEAGASRCQPERLLHRC